MSKEPIVSEPCGVPGCTVRHQPMTGPPESEGEGETRVDERIAVWPCDHGNVLVESGPAKPGYTCHECGAVATTYVPLRERVVKCDWCHYKVTFNPGDPAPPKLNQEDVERIKRRVYTEHDGHGYSHGLGPCVCSECRPAPPKLNQKDVERVEKLFTKHPELREQWWCDKCAELRIEDPCQDCGSAVRRIPVAPTKPAALEGEG